MCSTLSNLPLLSNAGSIISGRLVAATTITPSIDSTPSIELSNWLTTLFITSEPSPVLLLLTPAILSNSSKKIIEGLDCFAFLNNSLTAFSESPTHLDINSGPLIVIKLALASLAIALAISVLPVPGAPKRTIPLGGLIPKCSNISGLVRGHSILSFNLSLTSFNPPTCSQLTSGTSRKISLRALGSISLIANLKSDILTSIFSSTSAGICSSSKSISGRYLRRAFIAASLTKAEISAPTKP